MIEKDREIWVEESRFYLDEDNILYEIVVGTVDEKLANAMEEAAIKLRNMVEGQVNVFVDLNNAGKPTSEARKIGKARLEEEGIGKVALFGLHPVARVIASFIIGVTKKEDMRFFKTKDEAITWLKE